MRKTLSLFLTVVMVFSVLLGADLRVQAASTVTLTFSNSGITETVSGSGYSISGTTLTISSNGVYKVTGSCSEGAIEVKKELTNVVLILSDLTLTSSETAPVVVKKSSSVTLHLDGTTTLTNNQDPANETSTDEAVADAFEGAAIKVKSGSSLTVCGDGTLNVYGKAKNGIKGAATSTLTVNSGTINVKEAANNGIAFDGSITINGGTFQIIAENDGMKSVPDQDDTESKGTITINGGVFDIDVNGDGIQAEQNLTIHNGTFDIKTLDGYNSSSFNADTMSCKGIKASSDREDIENTITITGGTFKLNTADDAIHSDTYAIITGGTFDIYTGDDGVHADTTLTLGAEDGYERDPEITIYASYEGLEAGTIYTYSGKYYVTASDDGINAAGGSSNGSDPGGGGGNTFRPGGGGPGSSGRNTGGSTGTNASDYNIYFYGGDFYVNCQGDGLDSNGGMYMYGGNFTILSQAQGGDNSPLDTDGTLLIQGATVFAAGTNPMNENPASTSQTYTTTTTNYSAGTVINVKSGSTTLDTEKLLRKVNYMLYSSPDVSSKVSFSTGSLDACNSNAWAHNWDDGTIVTAATETTEGKMVYTCQDCSETEYKTIPVTTTVTCDGHETTGSDSDDDSAEDVTQYTGTFVVEGADATIDVYYTQDTSEASETDVTTAAARNSETGEVDISGSGQINFKVNAADGYEVDQVEVTSGTYTNLKTVDKDNYIYRITKVSSDLTVTVTTKAADSEESDTTQYTGTFVVEGADATIDVYYTQDTTGEKETNVTTAAARNADTGAIDISGDGQINFQVNPAEGYVVSSVTATEGNYKNIKNVSGNRYRITKITGDLTITVTLEKTADTSETDTDTTDTGATDTGTTDTSGTDTGTTDTGGTDTGTTDTGTTDTGATDTSGTDTGGTTASGVDTSGTATSSSQSSGNENSDTTTSRLTQKGEDGTALGKGASFEAADQAITQMKSDSDPAGSIYHVLCAKASKVTKSSVKLTWKKASGAVKYVIYANKCGKKNTFTKVATVSKNTYTYKKLNAGTYYKFLVVALDRNDNVISTSKIVYAATSGAKVGNYKSISTKGGTKITLKLGKTYQLKGKTVKGSLTVKSYRAVGYESSDTSVATVTKSGVIKTVGKGSCYVYVYGQSGVYKRVKVTVK